MIEDIGIVASPATGRRHDRLPPTAQRNGERTERESVAPEKKEIRYCPYCGMTAFELTGEEEGRLYCEYCGVDVEVKELVP